MARFGWTGRMAVVIVIVIAVTTLTIAILIVASFRHGQASKLVANDTPEILRGHMAAAGPDEDALALEDAHGVEVGFGLGWREVQQLHHGVGHDFFRQRGIQIPAAAWTHALGASPI